MRFSTRGVCDGGSEVPSNYEVTLPNYAT